MDWVRDAPRNPRVSESGLVSSFCGSPDGPADRTYTRMREGPRKAVSSRETGHRRYSSRDLLLFAARPMGLGVSQLITRCGLGLNGGRRAVQCG